MTGTTLINSTNNKNFISVANNLIYFYAPKDISYSISIKADNLTVDSLMSIINNLAEVKNTQTLEIGNNNIRKLSDEQIAIATSKNWTVC